MIGLPIIWRLRTLAFVALALAGFGAIECPPFRLHSMAFLFTKISRILSFWGKYILSKSSTQFQTDRDLVCFVVSQREQDLCRASAGLEDFIVQLIDRVLILVRNAVLDDISVHAQKSNFVFLKEILAQTSLPIFKVLNLSNVNPCWSLHTDSVSSPDAPLSNFKPRNQGRG